MPQYVADTLQSCDNGYVPVYVNETTTHLVPTADRVYRE